MTARQRASFPPALSHPLGVQASVVEITLPAALTGRQHGLQGRQATATMGRWRWGVLGFRQLLAPQRFPHGTRPASLSSFRVGVCHDVVLDCGRNSARLLLDSSSH